MKANKLYTFYNKYSNIVVYEYRGHKYEVEYSKSFDYCSTSPKIQHENNQRKIDEMLDNPSNSQPIDWEEIWSMFEI